MTRRTAIAVVVILLAAAGAGGAYYWRMHRSMSMVTPPAQAGTAMPAPSATVADQPRGEVTIDARRQQLIGVRIVTAERRSIGAIARTTGVVRFDETRQVDVNVKVDGWIRELDVDFTGQPVRRGQRLFTLYSPELLATQNEFLLALRNRDQAQSSPLQDSRDYANRLVDAARQRLALWDLSAEDLRTIETTRQSLQALAFTSPAAGLVVEKQAVKGMHVAAGQTLYKIADLSVVWLDADVYEQDMSLVRIGQRATISFSAYPDLKLAGRAIYVYPEVDPQTRTGKVRFELSNPAQRLKPGMFATVELRGAETTGLVVPADAVLDSGTRKLVFVAMGDGVFTPREVKTGRQLTDVVEILEGLTEGEQVAASATFFLDSESQLRAGLQNYEAPSSAAVTAAAAGPAPTITFKPPSEPAKTGENTFEVQVVGSDGKPVTDADVSVQLFMPAMPTMNMPAMRNETTLPHVGGGIYRGPGQVLMAGRWDVTVTVSRNGQRLGSRQFALAAK
jgi:RND family efflux transporter MFP subunit